MTSPVATDRYPLFDVIRIVAALMVVLSHSFPLTNNAEPRLVEFPVLPWTLGHLGVIIFFTTSGYLVSQSWQRDTSGVRFGIRRVTRIWPGFIVVILLSALVLGPLATSLSTGTYLRAPETWSYITHNIAMQPITYLLPGVFGQNPLSAVNGSIWTLPYEVLCYVVLLIAGLLGLVRRWTLAAAFVAILVLFHFTVASLTVLLPDDIGGIAGSFLVGTSVWFVGGAVASQFRNLVVGRHLFALVALIAGAIGMQQKATLVAVPALVFLILYIGTLPASWAEGVSRFGDPSYGAYLYAFPIQQSLIALHGIPMNPWKLAVEASVLSLAAGYASWHLIERRGMAIGRAIITRTKRPKQASSPTPA